MSNIPGLNYESICILITDLERKLKEKNELLQFHDKSMCNLKYEADGLKDDIKVLKAAKRHLTIE